ncbi:AsmA family protein [Mucilaginibacter daejeonensis]|uniref:AsmA family protein n=1 Tax=Mucilaginibacter daejeonensis TaxID=398049 RepID=UPI001D17B2B9|nr:AsmA-like C-terminal region-containing protein [Mucilaginibacter daejeonensis]UEG54002.1 AsmA family protein [Mucilaginibacter daejeonensis]
MPKWLKILLKVVAAFVIVIVLAFAGLFIYINTHKTKILNLITGALNQKIDGKISIGDLETTFFTGFPDIKVSLKNVLVRDKRWQEHKHTLLEAKVMGVAVNTASLLRGTIRIGNITIRDASVDLYSDSTGYSNSSIFKKKDKTKNTNTGDSGGSATEFGKFTLSNVTFAVNNQKSNKLFKFLVNDLDGKMLYPDSGWRADLQMNVLAQSLAFNVDKGSFIKNKVVAGNLIAGFSEANERITIKTQDFSIGGDPFDLKATFHTDTASKFSIYVVSDKILWRSASSLVAANIQRTLNKFNMSKPLGITALISGGLHASGDPLIYVTGKVRDNKLSIPGGAIDSCSFDAVFTNNVEKNKGFNDENSVIRLMKLTGRYEHIPFAVDTGSILNLSKPIATGNFRSSFPLVNLNYLMEGFAKFTKGTADANFRYRADIVDYELNKPTIAGVINLKNADATFLPRKLKFNNTSLSLSIVKNDLLLQDTRVQSGRSVVMMHGRVNNFMNLYYNAPEKIVLQWYIKSPEIRLGEFLGFLSARTQQKQVAQRKGNSSNIFRQLGPAFDKGNAEIHMDVAKAYYGKFLATDVKADLLTTGDGVLIKNVGVKHAGGTLTLNGKLIQSNNMGRFAINTVVSNVNVREFFYAFDNFGLIDITYKNLKGYLSAKTNVSGSVTGAGALVPRSMHGNVDVSLRNAALLDYKPLISVGKFAFPFRNLNNIEIPKLDAHFNVQGDKIIISPMQFNSSLLNADIAGTYGLSRGTDIALDVPLRNPKKDEDITDKAELQKRRYKGIVLHLKAKDDGTGKVKIGFNKDRKKDDDKDSDKKTT